MEKRDPATDSEDEAFESADEGENEGGPSPSDGRHNTTKKTVSKASNVDEMKKGKREDNAEDSAALDIRSVEENTDNAREEKDQSASDVCLKDDANGKQDKDENSEEIGGNERGIEASVSKEGSNDDEVLAGKSDDDVINKIEKEITCDESTEAEPSTEQMHELPKEVGENLPVSQSIDRLAETTPQDKGSGEANIGSSGWGWGGWGSMLTKATSSVSSMLETVETQLGIPSPTEMARLAKAKMNEMGEESPVEEKDNVTETEESPSAEAMTPVDDSVPEKEHVASGAGLGSWLSGLGVSQISTLVQNTGKDIVSGSLDALEFVGKKTIDAISHGDPAFRRKRMTLSQAIREAKEREEQENKMVVEEDVLTTFSIEFDRFQGLAHLEALEMISRESEADLEKLLELSTEESMKESSELVDILKEKFKIDDKDEDDETENDAKDMESFEEAITEQVANLSLSVTPAKLIGAFLTSKSKSVKEEGDSFSPDDLFSETITCFAEMTARSVELFHKIGELMLLPDVKASFLAKARADALYTVCITLRSAVTYLSTSFATTLNESQPEKDEKISKLITDIYLEASNSSAYIDDSYRLLLPIFQLSAVKNS